MAKGSRGGRGRTIIQIAKDGLQLNGNDIEFDGDLTFTKNDPSPTKAQRAVLDTWEKNRESSKVEYANAVGYNGSEYGEIRGGKGSVNTPAFYTNNKGVVFTHIHPRSEADLLGGTFSTADLRAWSGGGGSTMRAVAKEGTYSISKGSTFNQQAFNKFMASSSRKHNTAMNKANKAINADYLSGKITYAQAVKAIRKNFNTMLVACHKDLINNQSQYGYHYYLEKR